MSRLPRAAALAGVFVFAASCGGPAPAPDPAPIPDEAPATGPVSTAPAATAPAPTAGAALTGAQVAEQVCGQCHSLEPPPLKAPPLTHVSRHLRSTFEDEEAAVDFVVAWATAPDSSRSILPPMARERFGLMPPQPLPADLLDAAARYIWSLSDGEAAPEAGMGPGGMGRGGMGPGGMHRGGMGPGGGMGRHGSDPGMGSGEGMRLRMRGGGGGAGPAGAG